MRHFHLILSAVLTWALIATFRWAGDRFDAIYYRTRQISRDSYYSGCMEAGLLRGYQREELSGPCRIATQDHVEHAFPNEQTPPRP